MTDPFYDKVKRKKKSQFMAADAWLDSSLYEFGEWLGGIWQAISGFFDRFRVTGFRKFLVEVASDGLTFAAMGLVLMTALARPAFDLTAWGSFNPTADIAVTFLDKYGNEIGRRGIRTDDSVALSEIPDILVNATLATEDQHFYSHFGIDIAGTLRALLVNAQANSALQGGSSITQQLAKNLFLSSERTIERKIKEAFLAIWLEAHYSKDEILKLYFDRAYMGGGNFGVVAAAEYYYGKKVQDISLAEAAMLAGLFKAPTRYAPHIDLAAARGRANVVLSRMVDAGFLTEGQVAGARRNPASSIENTDERDAPNYFLDWAYERVKELVVGSDSVGFVVKTTLDPALQAHAEEAVASVIREEGPAFDVSQAAMVVMEPGGAVQAMVGGLDYGESQFNRATTPTRQPGSSFKPFVYATALEYGDFTPRSVISDRRVCIGDWCPQNYGRSYAGRVTLKTALTRSINTVPVSLSIATGRAPIADLAHRMGIRNDFPITRSLALGVISVSVLDMASSYAVFANQGKKAEAFGITSITTLRGEQIYEASREPGEQILSEETVAEMNDMLRNVVTSGTGRRADVIGVPAAGKTGTTQSYRDAWFCGYTGNYVAAVWYGNDDYTPTNDLTGGRLPAQTWGKFMDFAHSNIEIKPVLGVDFTPAPFEVTEASADGDGLPGAERPPVLTPEASEMLGRIATLFGQARREVAANGDQASLIGPPLSDPTLGL